MVKDLLEKKYPVLCLIVILGFLVYSNTFSVPFQFDDDSYVVNNPLIRTFHYFLAPQDVAELDRLSPVNFPSVLRYAFMTRILGYLSLAVNYRLNGLDVAGYHGVNLLLHILNGFLLYFILESVMGKRAGRGSGVENDNGLSRVIPPVVSLLFVVHPLQTHAVTYITSRFVLLAAFFFLLSLFLYIKSFASDVRLRRHILYITAVLSAVAAMLSKEFTIILPFIIMLCDVTFLEGSLRERIRRLAPISLTLMVIPTLVFIQQRSLGALDSTMRTITAADVSKISRIDYLLTQFRVIVTYLRLIFFPIDQNLDHDVPVYQNFLAPPVFLSFLILFSLFAVAAILFYRSTLRLKHATSGLDPSPSNLLDYRLISFGILWFFITLSVESSILPLGELIAEYRLYLPSIGLFIAFSSSLHLLLNRLSTDPKRTENLLISVLTIAVAVLSFAAHARNGVWKDEITLWEDAARKSPAKLRPRQNLGTYYQISGRLEEAKRELLIALKIDPGNFEIHNNLGIVYRKLGDYSNAIREYETALRLMPADPMARYNLGNIYLALGRYDDALEEYQECLKIIPDYDELHNNLGVVYQNTGRFREAVREFETAVRINPENKNARKNLQGSISSLNK